MERAEFIKRYADRSGLGQEVRRYWGLQLDSTSMVAVRCDCGERDCEGWAMLHPWETADRLEGLERRLAEAVEALKPFAALACHMDAHSWDERYGIVADCDIVLYPKDLRRAASVAEGGADG